MRDVCLAALNFQKSLLISTFLPLPSSQHPDSAQECPSTAQTCPQDFHPKFCLPLMKSIWPHSYCSFQSLNRPWYPAPKNSLECQEKYGTVHSGQELRTNFQSSWIQFTHHRQATIPWARNVLWRLAWLGIQQNNLCLSLVFNLTQGLCCLLPFRDYLKSHALACHVNAMLTKVTCIMTCIRALRTLISKCDIWQCNGFPILSAYLTLLIAQYLRFRPRSISEISGQVWTVAKGSCDRSRRHA